MDVVRSIVDNVFMKRVGLYVVMVIRRRTKEGKFLPGTTSENYSVKPFAMPLLAAGVGVGEKLYGMATKKQGASLFVANSGNLWVVITGGYKNVRELAGYQSSKVDLTWSGRMLGNLGILPGSITPGEASLGFTLKEAKERALWHNVMGAGKSKSKHVFMGLTKPEEDELAKFIGRELAEKFKAALVKQFNQTAQAA